MQQAIWLNSEVSEQVSEQWVNMSEHEYEWTSDKKAKSWIIWHKWSTFWSLQ